MRYYPTRMTKYTPVHIRPARLEALYKCHFHLSNRAEALEKHSNNLLLPSSKRVPGVIEAAILELPKVPEQSSYLPKAEQGGTKTLNSQKQSNSNTQPLATKRN